MSAAAWSGEEFRYFLRKAYKEAEFSVDPSTQNGALLITENGAVEVTGCNELPERVHERPERWERPLKYEYVEHAERNVIYTAAAMGLRTTGLIMVCPWASCADCARAIIQSGISCIVTHYDAYLKSPERWKGQIDRALGMLHESGICVFSHAGKIGDIQIRFNGELWEP